MWATGSALRLQSDIAAGTLSDRPGGHVPR